MNVKATARDMFVTLASCAWLVGSVFVGTAKLTYDFMFDRASFRRWQEHYNNDTEG